MKQLYTVPLHMEASSQQEAEQKINKFMNIAAGYKPTIWDALCLVGVAYVQGRYQEYERQKAVEKELSKHKVARRMRVKRAAKVKSVRSANKKLKKTRQLI
jgi:hypothetical protein